MTRIILSCMSERRYMGPTRITVVSTVVFYLLFVFEIEDVTTVNIAFGKPAVQSSVVSSGTADRAVDGNSNPNWRQDSCIHTLHGELEQWWMVDLLAVYNITDVWIQNRGDMHGYKLHDFVVEVYSENPVSCGQKKPIRTTCNTHPGAAGLGENVHMPCQGETIGRYVQLRKLPEFIRNPNHDILIVCEVFVEGNKVHRSYRGGDYAKYQGKKMSTDTDVITRITAIQCAMKCTDIDGCYGINVSPRDGGCQLITQIFSNLSLTEDLNWNHYTLC